MSIWTRTLEFRKVECQKPDTVVPSRAARLGWGGEEGLINNARD
jgi:hypothetical protein